MIANLLRKGTTLSRFRTILRRTPQRQFLRGGTLPRDTASTYLLRGGKLASIADYVETYRCNHMTPCVTIPPRPYAAENPISHGPRILQYIPLALAVRSIAAKPSTRKLANGVADLTRRHPGAPRGTKYSPVAAQQGLRSCSSC